MQPFGLTALFLLGLLGSGHCVGMCGPLIIAFPARLGGWPAHLVYHLGRLLTYTLVGAGLGSMSSGAIGVANSPLMTAHIQIVFSLLSAAFLALFGLAKLGLISEPALLAMANPARIPGFAWLHRKLASARRDAPPVVDDDRQTSPPRLAGGLSALFMLGLLLGLLPCGLSFAAFARALGAGGALAGATMTLAFGLGTLPALLFIGGAATRLSAHHRRLSDIVAAMLMIGMAAALLLAAFGAMAKA